MSWVKAGLIAVGALIAFLVVESVLGLLHWMFIALVIAAVIGLAVKARSQYRLMRQHRAEVRADKATRKTQDRRGSQVTAAPVWEPGDTAPPPRPAGQRPAVERPAATGPAGPQPGVEEELARLKREMGA